MERATTFLVLTLLLVAAALLFFGNTSAEPTNPDDSKAAGSHSVTKAPEAPEPTKAATRPVTPRVPLSGQRTTKAAPSEQAVTIRLVCRTAPVIEPELYLFDGLLDKADRWEPKGAKTVRDMVPIKNGYTIRVDGLKAGHVVTVWSKTTVTTGVIYRGGSALNLALQEAHKLIVQHLNIPRGHELTVVHGLQSGFSHSTRKHEALLSTMRWTDGYTLFDIDCLDEQCTRRCRRPQPVRPLMTFTIRSRYHKTTTLAYSDGTYKKEWHSLPLFTKTVSARQRSLTVDFGQERTLAAQDIVLVGSERLAGRSFWIRNTYAIPNKGRRLPPAGKHLVVRSILDDSMKERIALRWSAQDDSGLRAVHIPLEAIRKPFHVPEIKDVVVRRDPRGSPKEEDVEFGLRRLEWGINIAKAKLEGRPKSGLSTPPPS